MDISLTRRDLLRTAGVAAGSLAVAGCEANGGREAPVGPAAVVGAAAADGPYSLEPLPYAYDALEPFLDARTLRLHHDKHHAGYVKGLNAALARTAAAERAGNMSMVRYWADDLAFYGAGHVLHSLYWANMTGAGGGGAPGGPVAAMLRRAYGSLDVFAKVFAAVTVAVPGSGWGVLAWEPLGRRLVVTGVRNHENVDLPGSTPLLVCDVWEHAYYLKYQNRRGEYVEAFLKHLVDWDAVNRRLAAAMG